MTGAQDENILSKRLSARLVSAIFSIPYCDFASDCGAWCLSVRLQEDAPKAGMEPVNSLCLCGGSHYFGNRLPLLVRLCELMDAALLFAAPPQRPFGLPCHHPVIDEKPQLV